MFFIRRGFLFLAFHKALTDFNTLLASCPGGGKGRHKGLKIPRLATAVPVQFRPRAFICFIWKLFIFPHIYSEIRKQDSRCHWNTFPPFLLIFMSNCGIPLSTSDLLDFEEVKKKSARTIHLWYDEINWSIYPIPLPPYLSLFNVVTR